MGPKTRGVFQRIISVGLDVVYKAFLGDDADFLESIHPLSDIDVDIATRVSDVEEGVSNDHLVWMSLRWIRMYWKLAIGLLR